MFLNIACILTLFNITAPVDEKLEPNFDEEHILRCVSFYDSVPSLQWYTIVIDAYLKDTGAI